MVMNQVISGSRRVGVAAAKARFSAMLRMAAAGPVVIHNRGQDVAVLLAASEWERLAASSGVTGGAAFLAMVQRLRQQHGAGAELDPPRARLSARVPFARPRPRRR